MWICDNLLNNSTLSSFLSHLHWSCENTFICKVLSQRDGKSLLENVKGLKSQENENLTTGLCLAYACANFHSEHAVLSPILFTRVDNGRTRGDGFKLKEGRFKLDFRGMFFTERVLRCWNRLPRDVVDAPSLEVFKARLDGALCSLV